VSAWVSRVTDVLVSRDGQVSRGARCEGVSCGVGLRDGLVVPAGDVAGVVASMEGCPTRHVIDVVR